MCVYVCVWRAANVLFSYTNAWNRVDDYRLSTFCRTNSVLSRLPQIRILIEWGKSCRSRLGRPNVDWRSIFENTLMLGRCGNCGANRMMAIATVTTIIKCFCFRFSCLTRLPLDAFEAHNRFKHFCSNRTSLSVLFRQACVCVRECLLVVVVVAFDFAFHELSIHRTIASRLPVFVTNGHA